MKEITIKKGNHKMLRERLWGIVLELQKTKIGQSFIPFLMDSFIVKLYNDYFYYKDTKHPTDDMIHAQFYFQSEENQGKIEFMLSHLEDDKSKETFKKVIKYRQTHLKEDRPSYNRKDQYFPKDVIELCEDEVFVDCGAYNGDTIRSFLNVSNNKYKKIVAFEPDPENVESIQVEKSIVIEACVWSENTELLFENGFGSGSKISEYGKNSIRAVSIDSVDECKDVTFLKMDIEGAEYNALLGAENTIKMKKPILAICIYHSDEDILRIFELIYNYKLDYKFYIRHHAQLVAETVLYAIPANREKRK